MSAFAPFDLAHEIEQQAQALNKIAPGLPRPVLVPHCGARDTGGTDDGSGGERGLPRWSTVAPGPAPSVPPDGARSRP